MKIDFNLVGSATWVINVDKKFKIACDPALSPVNTKYVYKGIKTSRIKAPIHDEKTFENVRIWLLTHCHFDHLDKKGMAKINENSVIISHKNCQKMLEKHKKKNVLYLDRGKIQRIEVDGYDIEIKAIPAHHAKNFLTETIMGGVNGYLITITDDKEEKNIYITSDTLYKQDVADALTGTKIDVMIANVGSARKSMLGGPFTMDISMLNRFLETIKPSLTIPVHVNDFEHFEMTRKDLNKINDNFVVKFPRQGEPFHII